MHWLTNKARLTPPFNFLLLNVELHCLLIEPWKYIININLRAAHFGSD